MFGKQPEAQRQQPFGGGCCKPGGMGGERDIGKPCERVIGWQRLAGKDIEPGMGKVALPEGRRKRRLIDKPAPGSIDQDRAGLHGGNAPGIEPALCFGGER